MSLERQRAAMLIHLDEASGLFGLLLAVVQDDLRRRDDAENTLLLFFLWEIIPAASLTFRFHSPWKIAERRKAVKTLAPVRWFPFQPVIACVSIPNPVFLARRPLSSKLMAFTPEVKVPPATPRPPSPQPEYVNL